MADYTLNLLLAYCARGWAIFPQSNKVPLIKGGHGFNGASKDPAQVTAWFREYPDCQWAAATGPASGISVLDIDPDHGGETELERLLAAYDEPIPNTLTARSGGGGLHFYFKLVPGLRSSAGRVGDGIDIKSEGGSITLPPSLHASGQRYKWLNDADLADFPKWLRALAERVHSRAEEREAKKRAEEARERYKHGGVDERARRYAEAAVDDAIRAVKGAGDGKRRNTLNSETYSLAQLVGAGILDRALAENGMREAGLVAGLTSREVDATVKAALIDGIKMPRAPRFEDRPMTAAPRAVNGHDARPEPPPPASSEEYGQPIGAGTAAGEQEETPRPTVEMHNIRPLSDDIPPRRWILGRTFCRGFLHGIVGAGSAGKTALRVTQLLSIASGRSLTGEEVHESGVVLLFCFEDDRDEIERRIRAAMVHHGLDEEDVMGSLRFAIVRNSYLAEMRNDGRAIPGQFYRELDAILERERPLVATIDPLAGAHQLDENDNTAMVALAQMLADLGQRYACAIDYVHHTKKGPGEAGDVERSRGASGLIFHSRIVQVVTTMTIEEARQLGLPDRERRSYLRLDDGKINIAPASDEARWFQLKSVRLANGDSVQAVQPWHPEGLFDNVSNEMARAALMEIHRGHPDGRLYSSRFAPDNAAWRAVQRIFPDRTDKQCFAMVERWIANGALASAEYKDPETRKPKKGLKVVPENMPQVQRTYVSPNEPELGIDAV